MRTEVILLALLVILGLQNTIKPIGIDAEGVLECEGKLADIAFIIDASRSIYPPDFDKGIDFLQSFVKIFQIGPDYVRIAAVSFGRRVITGSAFGFDQHNGEKEILKALTKIRFQPKFGGSTNTAMALNFVRKKIFINARPNVKKIAIVLTDGRSDNFRKTKAEADRLKSQGVDIITIGVGRGAVEKELKAIASYDEDVFKVNSYGALKDIKRKLGLITCKAITTPAPTTTTTTTQPPKTEPCDGQTIDLNFVFDPTQLGTTGTDDTIRFIKTVVSAEDLNNGKVRVGTITGPYRNTKGFHLNSYKNLPAILTHFDTYNKTEMNKLITDLRMYAFRPKNGGRAKARKVGVVFLKGKLSDPGRTVSAAKLAKVYKIEIFIVNMGSLNHESVLESMASGKSTHILRASDPGGIINMARSFVAQICKKKTEPDG